MDAARTQVLAKEKQRCEALLGSDDGLLVMRSLVESLAKVEAAA